MNLWFSHASHAAKPRTMHMCDECATPCFPGIARNKMQYIKPGTTETHTGHFHVACFPKFVARLIRDHRTFLKEKA